MDWKIVETLNRMILWMHGFRQRHENLAWFIGYILLCVVYFLTHYSSLWLSLLLIPFATFIVFGYFALLFSTGEVDVKRRVLLMNCSSLIFIRGMDWGDFEALVGAVFSADRWQIKKRGGNQPDGGVDLEGVKEGKKIIIQCKKYVGERVGVKLARELLGVVVKEGADEGILITPGEFTPDAMAFAEGTKIRLLDGAAFYRLAEQCSVKAAEEADEVKGYLEKMTQRIAEVRLPLTRRPEPICPTCGAAMEAKYSQRNSEWFWGCRQYKAKGCKGSLSLCAAEIKLVDGVRRVG